MGQVYDYDDDEIWTTIDGKEIPIEDLEDDHLKNIITMLHDNYSNKIEVLKRKEQYKNLIKESKKRFRKRMLKTKLGRILYDL